MPSDFVAALSIFESTIWSYARHYSISGVIEPQDLYQDGLMELHKMLGMEQYQGLSEDTFSTYFKTRLASKFLKCIRHSTQKKRDWKSTVHFRNIEDLVDSKDSTDVEKLQIGCIKIDASQFDRLSQDPETELEHMQKIEEARQFIVDVKAGLDDEAQWLFDQMLIGDVPDEVKGEFKRVPSHASITVLGMIFGWDRARTWRIMQKVRRRAAYVIKRNMLSGSSMLWNEENTKNIINKTKRR